MKMIVGLGNIGQKYAQTRHNIGFMVVDKILAEKKVSLKQTKQAAMIAQTTINAEKVLLVEPTTYMNDSGIAVKALMDYYNIDLADVLIIHDDMDRPMGQLRLRQKGSAGGHNGLKSIIAHTGSSEFKRLKFGIDHPQHNQEAVVNYVLGKFSKEQQASLEDGIILAMQMIEYWLTTADFQKTMNKFN
ncbi:aminoacyl-tRNA hydrolase [Periweissella beninensis]|uniref:Peptidyl-tRNA hydrolase n=1 Tax=Periweissella beninensis TaxID=504936 RepID=A0ABT0VJ41_9LACO|nr:aminoacyl-tRNA hydrolase [Periweissella beninensis]MBM7544388.1 PTH1 family peptidyl-tRNA hydrolase [Periweissella beninensis]MCM2437846.1 aminoacyl-tRNA hydrolase [Periweissella beninensis]MCT4396375.1 aminoacyl-tRNA hydrolase [Periweissella beninensis]